MVEITKLEFSTSDLKLLLTVLDVFNNQLRNKKTRLQTLLLIHKSEKFYNFDFDIKPLVFDLEKFLDAVIGIQADKLFDAYLDLASNNGTLKPLQPEEERYTFEEALIFGEIDLKTPMEAF